MNIEINGVNYTVKFGLGFIKKMDQLYSINENGIKFGLGIGTITSKLAMNDPVACEEVIKNSIVGKKLPTSEEIEDYLEREGVQAVCENFIQALSEAPLTKGQLETMKEAQTEVKAKKK